MRRVRRQVATGVIAATFIAGVASSIAGAPVLASPAPTAPLPGSSAATAAHCGQLDGGVFYVGDSVDPAIHATFSVAGRVFQAADFDVLTLAVLEIAWVARQDVCIEEDSAQVPVGASTEIDVCGDVLVGATFFLYRTGTGAVGPDGRTDQRQGFVHDAFLGFRLMDVSGQPVPPNFFSALDMATARADQDDCLRASLAWTDGSDPLVAASIATPACLIAERTSGSTATFFSPAAERSYTFRLTAGSLVDPAFDAGELAGATVTAKRSLDGPFTIEPRDVDSCPSALSTPIPSIAPAPSGTAVPSPSEAAVSPSLSLSPVPSVSTEPTSSTSPTPAVGAVAGGSPMPRSSLDAGPTSRVGTESPGPSPILVLAGLLVAAAGVIGLWFAHGRYRAELARAARTRSIAEAPQPDAMAAKPLDAFGLTPREREVIAMVARGMSNREIAEALYISESTAGVHVSNILGKLGVGSRTEAARFAIEAARASAPPPGPVH